MSHPAGSHILGSADPVAGSSSGLGEHTLGQPTLGQHTLGELVASATKDLSTLVRKEIELAKLELKVEAKSAGKGAGMLGGAGFSGLMGLIFLSIAAAYAIGRLVPLGAGFLIVGALYVLVAGVLALLAKKNLSKVGPPQKTVATVKGDIAWAKHPTSVPTKRMDEVTAGR